MFYKDVVRGLTTKKANLTRREILIGKNRCYKLLKRVHFEREKNRMINKSKKKQKKKENVSCLILTLQVSSFWAALHAKQRKYIQ